MTFRDVLVICTRNRPLDLERCLNSVTKLSEIPATVFVVDSSTDQFSKRLTEEFARNMVGTVVNYIRSDQRGLVMARNVALANLPPNADIVHFVDDDTELDKSYIKEINKILRADSGCVGAGGVVNEQYSKPSNRLLNLLLLDSDNLGRVLRSGVNIGSYNSVNPISMEWLPGCSMSFRVDRISGLTFDEKRNIWPLGEDVDFGLKASSRGTLKHVPTASLIHHLSPTNRDEELTIIFQDVIHRWTLAKDRLGRVNRLFVFSSTASWITIYLVLALRNLDSNWLKKAFSAARGLWVSIFRGGLKASRLHLDK